MQEESKSPEPKKMRVGRCAVKFFRNIGMPACEPSGPLSGFLEMAERNSAGGAQTRSLCAVAPAVQSIFHDGVFPQPKSHADLTREATELPARAKRRKGSATPHISVLARSR